MRTTLKDINYIMKLAHLELNEIEREKDAPDLNHILFYLNRVGELNGKDVKAEETEEIKGGEMGITLKEVDYIAELARLELNKLEREQYTNDLNQILSYVDKLNELNTKGIDPTTHVVELTNVLRTDREESSSVQGKILNNAPEIENSCFKVKKIIE